MEVAKTESGMVRNLKVYEVRDRRGRTAPQMRLQGQWLEDCGFSPGTRIKVVCSEGMLVIQRAETIKVLVSGSRSIEKFDLSPYIPEHCGLIISGGAKGIDTVAEQYALAHGIESKILKPDYEQFGRAAPLKRNDEMVELADLVIAIWDGKSHGTKHTIDYAKKIGKEIQVITITIE